jgi:hypothetical protein
MAGIFKGLMDATADEGLKNLTWQNKYNFTRHRKHWWYLGFHTPRYPERFPFSSTIFVFLTDRWHFYQFAMLRCFYLAVSVLITHSIILIIAYSFLFFPIIVGQAFESTYTSYRKKLSKK